MQLNCKNYLLKPMISKISSFVLKVIPYYHYGTNFSGTSVCLVEKLHRNALLWQLRRVKTTFDSQYSVTFSGQQHVYKLICNLIRDEPDNKIKSFILCPKWTANLHNRNIQQSTRNPDNIELNMVKSLKQSHNNYDIKEFNDYTVIRCLSVWL